MPEPFEHLLSGAVEDASRAAGTPGAAAARARGRRLRNRRRATAAALSLTMLVGAGSAAAITLGRGNGGVPSTVSTTTVTTSGPTAMSSPSTTPSATSSTSPSQPSSTDTRPSGSQSTAKVPAPGTVVGAAWLSPSQMPFGTGYQSSWQVSTGTVGTLLGDSVYRENTVMANCSEEMPGEAVGVALSKGLAGDQFKLFTNQGIQVTSQDITGYTSQETLFYSSVDGAQTAWQKLPSALRNSCPPEMTGTVAATGTSLVGSVQQTLNEPEATCWSTVDTPTGSAQNATTDVMHVCFVRSGPLISLVTVLMHDSGSPAVSFDSIDPATVSALRQALAAYESAS